MYKTLHGLVLREVKYKESSKILTILTEEEGKITAEAKGVLRKGSRSAASAQALVWSELTVSEYRGRYTLTEGSVTEDFSALRSDLADYALGCYFAELAEAVSDEDFPNGPQRHYLRHLSGLSKRSIGPAYRLEHLLNPWENFLIMPVFALANAGVEITDPSYFNVFGYDAALGSASMGIFLGLLLGKPVGITLASWIAIKCKVGEMPAKATWAMFFAVACLGGIGFTMSIFVDTLSFAGEGIPAEVTQHLRDAGKIAVLLGSLCAGVFGSLLITAVNRLQKGREKE